MSTWKWWQEKHGDNHHLFVTWSHSTQVQAIWNLCRFLVSLSQAATASVQHWMCWLWGKRPADDWKVIHMVKHHWFWMLFCSPYLNGCLKTLLTCRWSLFLPVRSRNPRVAMSYWQVFSEITLAMHIFGWISLHQNMPKIGWHFEPKKNNKHLLTCGTWEWSVAGNSHSLGAFGTAAAGQNTLGCGGQGGKISELPQSLQGFHQIPISPIVWETENQILRVERWIFSGQVGEEAVGRLVSRWSDGCYGRKNWSSWGLECGKIDKARFQSERSWS